MTSRHRLLAVVAASAFALTPLPAAAGETEPAPADESEEGRFHFDVGWDDGVTYRLEARLGGLEPTGVLRGGAIEGRIGGSLYLDGGWGRGDPLSPEGWGAAVRRARLYTSGAISHWVRTEYKFQFAIEDRDIFLNDFYLRWRPDRFVDSLRVGYFDPPSSLQNLRGSSSRPLIEVAAPVSAFVPGFRLGVEASGASSDPSLAWFLSVASVGQSQKVGDNSDQPLRLGGRLVWRPWGEAVPDRPLLHLGASLGWSPAWSGGTVRHRARPESFLVDNVVSTGELDGANTLLGTEFVWRRGSVAVQSEVLVSRLHGSDLGNPIFYGAYLQTSWALTGEVRGYDERAGYLRRLVPKSPFRPGGGGTGALDVAARLSWLDLAEDDVDGGRLVALSLGPSWTWNEHVRWLAGWVVGRVSGLPDDGWLVIYQARFELVF